jgi:hypothetical protein
VKDHPFAGLVIRSVLAGYAIWGAVVIADLFLCLSSSQPVCETQRAEVRGAAASIPATLLAWLADSPVNGGNP